MDENRFWILASKMIAGELSADETTELELLFMHNPDFRDIISNLASTHQLRPVLSPESEQQILKNLRTKLAAEDPSVYQEPVALPPLAQEEDQPGFWLRYRKAFVLSSVLALIVAVIVAVQMTNRVPDGVQPHFSENNVATKPGSRSQVKLPDGTNVTLNADSRLSYPDNFLGDTREVTLEGEAYFEVTENKAKPFIIHSKAMDIKVLGTVFNVKSYPDEKSCEASLIRGSIEVTLKNRRNEKIMLKPNEKITVSSEVEKEIPVHKNTGAGGVVTSKQRNTIAEPLISVNNLDMDEKEHIIREIGWTQNKLMFKNETLAAIAITLQRWYGRTVVINSEKLKQQKFTGNFNNENLMQVIRAMQVAYNFNFKIEDNIITIY